MTAVKKHRRTIVAIGTALLVGAILARWFTARSETETEMKIHRWEFAALPADDEAILGWMRSQPCVTDATVTREGKVLLVKYEIALRQPPLDLIGKLESLGYRDRTENADKKPIFRKPAP